MNILLLQTEIVWEQKKANFDRVSELLATQHIRHGSLVVLPEMFATGFSMNAASIAEDEDGETHAFLADLSATYRSFVIGGYVFAGSDETYFNRAACFAPDGQTLCVYHKMHPFSFSGEHRHYARGHEVASFEAGDFRMAPFVCYDLRFPEVYRAATLNGATLLVTIANWPAQRSAHWTALLRARAIENQAYVVGVNRAGNDPGNAYLGKSAVFDPKGVCIAEAGEEEEIVPITIRARDVGIYRRAFPALQDADERFQAWGRTVSRVGQS